MENQSMSVFLEFVTHNGNVEDAKIVACNSCGTLVLDDLSRLHVCVKHPEKEEACGATDDKKLKECKSKDDRIELVRLVRLGEEDMSLTYSDNDVQWAKMVSSLSMSIDLMFMEVSNKAQKLYDISHEIKDEFRIQFSKEGSSCQETKKPIQNSLRRREEP